MSKVALKLWKHDSKEPDWYNKCPDPLHRTDQSCDVQIDLVCRLTGKLVEWLKDKSIDFDRFISTEKSRWETAGGSLDVFEGALRIAFVKSGYYKKLLQ